MYAQFAAWAQSAVGDVLSAVDDIPGDHVLLRTDRKRALPELAAEAVDSLLAGEVSSLIKFFDRNSDETDKGLRLVRIPGVALLPN